MPEAARRVRGGGLGEHIHREGDGLALGKKQTLKIARTLCCDPTLLLLLDERATGLDYLEKPQPTGLFRKLKEGVGASCRTRYGFHD